MTAVNSAKDLYPNGQAGLRYETVGLCGRSGRRRRINAAHCARIAGHLVAVMILACVADDVGADGQADPDQVKAVEREHDRVHQDGPWSKDQAKDAHQPGQVEIIESCGHSIRRKQPIDQEPEPRTCKE